MSRRSLPRLARAACAVLGVVCFWQACGAAAVLGWLYPCLGLRYSQPPSAAQVESAQAWQREADGAVFASFWRQDAQDVQAEATGREQPGATVVRFVGNAADCCGLQASYGTLPGAGDRAGCAVSAALADALWGSTDVLGQTVTLPGRSCVVVGVLDCTVPLLLCYGEEGLSYPNVELRGISPDAPTAGAKDFARSAGLGEPPLILYGPQLAWLANLLCLLPPVLVGVLLLAAALRAVPQRRRGVLLFAAALAGALLLPTLLARLPGWLIPNRWSELSFWQRLITAAGTRLNEWRAMAPGWKEVQAKQAVEQCLLWVLCSVGLLFAALRYENRRYSK